MIPKAEAQEPYGFLVADPALVRSIKPAFKKPEDKNCPAFKWTLDKEGYKNDILQRYQRMLCDAGITDKESLKLLSAQLAQENGAFTPDRLGDNGCSFGLIQYNACAKNRMNAKTFLKKNPEWLSVDHQLKWMVEQVKWRMDTFKSIKLTVISHNCPACAYRGGDSKAGYYKAVAKRSTEFTSL